VGLPVWVQDAILKVARDAASRVRIPPRRQLKEWMGSNDNR